MEIKENITKFVGKHNSVISYGMTGLCVVGLIYSTAKASIKAKEKIDEVKKELGKDKLTFKEKFKYCWKYFVPTALFAVGEVVNVGANNAISNNKLNASNKALEIAKLSAAKYTEKVIDRIGVDENKKIEAEIVSENKRDIVQRNDSFIGFTGDYWFYDELSGRSFKSNRNLVEKSINNLNANMVHNMYISLNDYYSELGLPSIDRSVGDECGWSVYKGMIDIQYTSSLLPSGEPCVVIEHLNPPKYDFMK